MNKVGMTINNKVGSTMRCIKYRGCNDIDVYFPEYNWTAEHVQYSKFKQGSIKCPYEPRVCGVGYLGEGIYEPSENGIQTNAYKTWYRMFRRCYDTKYHEKEPSYIDCEVCEEWHNFQNFAEWYEQNYYEIPGEQMALDKDILVKGNKIYSPQTCIFVSKNINTIFTKRESKRGLYPIGVCYNKRVGKYESLCNIRKSHQKHIGYYSTPEEAFQAYKECKENYIKQVADQYIDLIPLELYQAMINYEV